MRTPLLECLHMNCIVLLDGPRYGSTLGEVIVSEGLAGTFRLSFLLVNLTPEKNSHQILFNRTGCICLKTGIVLITIVTLGCSEPGTCQDGWNIPKVLN